MKEELKYQESKMQQYKKEVEKLRSQQSQRGKVGPLNVFKQARLFVILLDKVV